MQGLTWPRDTRQVLGKNWNLSWKWGQTFTIVATLGRWMQYLLYWFIYKIIRPPMPLRKFWSVEPIKISFIRKFGSLEIVKMSQILDSLNTRPGHVNLMILVLENYWRFLGKSDDNVLTKISLPISLVKLCCSSSDPFRWKEPLFLGFNSLPCN